MNDESRLRMVYEFLNNIYEGMGFEMIARCDDEERWWRTDALKRRPAAEEERLLGNNGFDERIA
jgi:hypothetical protein